MPTGSSIGRTNPISFSAATGAYARSSAFQSQYGLHKVSRPPLPTLLPSVSTKRSTSASSSRLRQQQRAKSTSCINGDSSAITVTRKLPERQQRPQAVGYQHANGSNSSSTTAARGVSGRGSRRGSIGLYERGLVGLSNLGNTCYMNSIVQCLSHTRPLLELLMRSGSSSAESVDPPPGRLAAAYQRLMRDMWSSGAAAVVSPTELRARLAKFAPRFRGSGQQDAQELLRYLLEGLHEDLSRNAGRHPRLPPIDYDQLDRLPDSEKSSELWRRYTTLENSPIVEIFVGQLKSTLQCCECRHKSTTFDPFWDLALPIPRGSRTSLAACLDLFTAQETLDGNERPKCDKCKARRRCLKSFCLYRLPNILVIHLKRFSGDRYKTKLNTLVEYPMELDLSEFVDSELRAKQSALYSLYAVSEHSGTPLGGHYTAIVRHAYAIDRWIAFNDSSVQRSSESAVVSPQGYVLFYERIRRSQSNE